MPDQGTDNPTGQTPRSEPHTPSAETRPAPDKKGKQDKPEPTTAVGKFWHNWVKPIGSVILIVVVLRSTLIDWNDVPTGSMEPEIQVGDRIAVNRLAYALQVPLTGPQIGVPFTPLQWDNPLDGIPQWQWGKPARGDIVTFWNPVTKVRMVKRIVAEPGDTIEMTGGKLTINGTAATYTDITPTPQRNTKFQQANPLGGTQTIYKPLEDLRETLLGETRVVQHIKDRWLDNASIIQKPDGTRDIAYGNTLQMNGPNGSSVSVPVQQLLANSAQYQKLAEFVNAAPQLNGQPVSYNDLAAELLKPYTTGGTATLLDKIGLGVQGHELLIDGQPVPFEFFRVELENQVGRLTQAERQALNPFRSTLSILHQALMTSFGPVTLGTDEYYMVGDNRNNSHDSRYFGPVDRGEITGEAFGVAFSFKDNKMFAIPPVPAWERFFKDLD